MDTGGNQNSEFLFGINTITTLLEENSGHRRIYRIVISGSRKQDSRIDTIRRLAGKRHIEVSVMPHPDFLRLVSTEEGSQNIMAEVSPYNPSELDYFLGHCLRPGSRMIIMDQVTDVGNFGSIIRNCRAFGFEGIIMAKKRSVSLGSGVSRISAGALEGVTIFKVPNLAMTIRKLKSSGFWIYGTTLEKGKKVLDLEHTEFSFPMALVMGSEHRGMSRVVTESCDVLISIRLTGNMQSLNVSVASGIILYHIQQKYREVRG